MNATQGELKGTALQPTGTMDPGGPKRPPVPVYSAETATGPDGLGRAEHAAFLAEVVAHRSAETPLCIGIFGPAGSGKSSFLAALLSRVEDIDRAATEAGLATPFHAGMTVTRVMVQPGQSTPRTLVAAVGAALAKTYPRLLDEALHAGLDARLVAREAADALAAARAQLEAERQALDALTGRQARLADAVLFETEGSGLDAYVRGNRGQIDRRMRALGAADDPVAAFKVHVRDAHEAGAPLARGRGWLRAFYGHRGQGRLLALVVALVLAAIGLHVLSGSQDKVIDAVLAGGDRMAGVADWLRAQWHWLTPLRRGLELCALAALAIVAVRGLGFILPVQRGVTLLRQDLETRRRELDGRLAHQTRRVDTLARDVERLSGRAAAAESRVPPDEAIALPGLPQNATEHDEGLRRAEAFFDTLGRAIERLAEAAPRSTPAQAPSRLVVGIDGLDRLSSAEAAHAVQVAAGLLGRPGFALVLAADRMHLATGLSETDPALASERLRRLVQVPFDLDAGEDWQGAAAYARVLIEGGHPGQARPGAPVEAALSTLDRPWTAAEGAILAAVAPLAGPTPRAVKHLVNLYCIARADPLLRDATAKDLAALALGLALQTRGLPPSPAGLMLDDDGAEGVVAARRAIAAILGASFTALDGARGYETARAYSAGR